MSKSIIVDGLSKQYSLGLLSHETMLREALVNLIRSPLRALQRRERETIWAVEDATFDVEEGEVVGIIGRNGAGKSTLLKLLSRITYPTAGSMTVRGRVSSLLEVGTGFHDELTGRENVFLNGSILGMKRREIVSKLDQIVEFAGVERFVDTPIKRYSSGMKLRLGFAVAAHLDPDVLFVDEVLAVGDADFQKKCLDAMDNMSTGGRTVLFVSHNMAAVDNLCPRTIWIEGGRIRADGPTKDIIRTYLESFAQASQTGYDLASVESRGGSGAVRFTGMEFLDNAGNPTNLVRTGEAMRMRLHFRCHEAVPSPDFGVEIYANTGGLVSMTSTWETGLGIQRLTPGEGHIDLDIDSLDLVPGRYYLSLWVLTVGTGKSTRYDVVDHCVALDVESSDVYGTGKALDSRWGVVVVPARWSYEGRSTRGRLLAGPGGGVVDE